MRKENSPPSLSRLGRFTRVKWTESKFWRKNNHQSEEKQQQEQRHNLNNTIINLRSQISAATISAPPEAPSLRLICIQNKSNVCFQHIFNICHSLVNYSRRKLFNFSLLIFSLPQ
ncbi:hypothetical protein JOB18_013476 [Solea senegalensis]|uniref:Uncharacterized protein n=1 Tax=Solea senegalensis TaxID=28829 RepID=A0AAV6QEL8_SOLSE|nr:hypothetical protein JOB18_013476 [Solea senegalensis]